MSSAVALPAQPAQQPPAAPPRARRRPPDVRALLRRAGWFWLVWTALLLVHELGHAAAARAQGLEVRRVTIGAGPVLWRSGGEEELVVRLVPLAGMTAVHGHGDAAASDAPGSSRALVLAGGTLATVLLALLAAGLVLVRERSSRVRCVVGRMLLADAIVLTAFNFLPVPPLDGGRAALELVGALRGEALPKGVLLWVQLGGLALAIVPMTLWTGWTRRIDAFAMRWRAPGEPDTATR